MPNLTYSENVNSTAQDFSTLTTASFTAHAGDVIVVKGMVEDTTGGKSLATPSDGTNTYTQRAVDATASHCWGSIWTAVAASTTSLTVAAAWGLGSVASWHSITVECWSNAVLAGTPVTVVSVGSGAPSASLTTTAAGSVVSWLNGDWNANSPSGRVYDSTSGVPVEDGLHNAPSSYVAYYAYQSAASAASQTLGLTSPGSQAFSLLGIEVQDGGGGAGGPVDQTNCFGLFPWQ